MVWLSCSEELASFGRTVLSGVRHRVAVTLFCYVLSFILFFTNNDWPFSMCFGKNNNRTWDWIKLSMVSNRYSSSWMSRRSLWLLSPWAIALVQLHDFLHLKKKKSVSIKSKFILKGEILPMCFLLVIILMQIKPKKWKWSMLALEYKLLSVHGLKVFQSHIAFLLRLSWKCCMQDLILICVKFPWITKSN